MRSILDNKKVSRSCFNNDNSRLLKSKRSAEMTIGTIIVIILAIVVLVFLVFGFSSGWSNLWDKIKNLGGGESNVDTIKQACAVACSTNGVNDFNNVIREVRFADKSKVKATCKALTNSLTAGPLNTQLEVVNFNNVPLTEAECKTVKWVVNPPITSCVYGDNKALPSLTTAESCSCQYLKTNQPAIVEPCSTLA